MRFELKHQLKALALICNAVEKCIHSYDNVKQVRECLLFSKPLKLILCVQYEFI